ncbi:hypothetical protein DH2020_028519 [Rehmannia glutinosa]|uniref:Enhancer of polycomb-like protein n=1 Tax=Rehmannia glutinosa TaxID=99300 RepID=A0ABR0VR57_REHGL
MPSVGMRRSTRVFGARVLRSGRRLWTEPQESSKNARTDHVENQWAELLENPADGGEDAGDLRKDTRQENENENAEPRTEERGSSEGVVEVKNVDRIMSQRLAVVVNQSSYECGCWITCFLTSVLSYMTRVRIGVRRLSTFLLSKPIFDAYSSRGVLFLQDSVTAKNPSICIISGSRSLIPLFSVNLSAIPSLFVHMQTSMYLRFAHMACLLVARSLDVYEKDDEVTDVDNDAEEPSYEFPSLTEQQDCIAIASQISSGRDSKMDSSSCNDNSVRKEHSHSAVGVTKSALRNLQSRNSRNIQKRRSSLRRKRGRPPTFRAQKASGTLAADFFRIRQEGVQFSAAASNRLLRSSNKSRPIANIKELKSTPRVLTQDVRASGCSVNLLITESDKCYREEGATITLELSASKQWCLSITKDGMKKYSLTAEKVMRPSCSNRFTHDVIWTVDGGSKLEFFNKQDWLIFKELYKECYDRNILSPAASVIPVPGVQEVFYPVDAYCKPYVRPDSYISVKDDELMRALVKKSANYDMDSDDERWLDKLNDELYSRKEHITTESFELIIDALEKGFHCNPDEQFDEQAAYDFCMHLERREVIQAIHNYWIKKRKQKRTALVKIFQLYQPRRIQVIEVSFAKEKIIQATSKPATIDYDFPITAIAAERDALEQQNNVHKLQEAKAAADRFEGLAILKRQKAQMLMANADLATYKAIMALRIAEAAQNTEAPKTVESFFLG